MGDMKSIVITGASTGIGRASALRLADEGFLVFAGVRRQKDADELKKATAGHLVPVMLDVTDAKSIAAAVKTVLKKTGGGLFGLMNNAGIPCGGPVELLEADRIRAAIDVNIMGVFAATRAFLPLLRRERGRIVNTGSIFGLVAFPGRSVYSATKFALEAISESLRLELRPFGITVSILEPGAIATEIWRKGSAIADELAEQNSPENYKLYRPLVDFYAKTFSEKKDLPAEAVADCVYRVFTARKPKRHYVLGADAKSLLLLKYLPHGVREWLTYKAIYK